LTDVCLAVQKSVHLVRICSKPALPGAGIAMKSGRRKISGIQAGVAGEYFVAAELSRRGYISSITLRSTKGIDILVSNQSASRSVGIQVKTKQGMGTCWVMGEKSEINKAENLFYVFVNLGPLHERPAFYVVPSENVADFIRRNHKKWIRTRGRSGKLHKDTPMRIFRDPKGEYLERWDLLELE
jgi:hypothetical protein